MIRVPEICTRGGDDTVLAHLRMAGLCGMGQKPHDMFGAWACFACHEAVDGRNTQGRDREWLIKCHLEGVIRTQQQLLQEGKL